MAKHEVVVITGASAGVAVITERTGPSMTAPDVTVWSSG